MRRKGWLLAGAVGAGVLAIGLFASRGPLVEVELAVVGRDALRTVVEEEGVTRVRDRYSIAAPVTGRLQRLELDAGDGVTAGQVVARIAAVPEDPRSRSVTRAQLQAADARRMHAAAEVQQTAAQAAQAEREAERRRDLATVGALSREALEQAELQAATARRRVEAARAALGAAEAEVRAVQARLHGGGGPSELLVDVTAPAGGRVLRVLEESERVVPAGAPLLEVGDASGLEVVVDVLSADAVRIGPGNRVEVVEWGGERPLPGRVRLVEPAAFTEVSALGVEEQRVNVIADLIDAPPELGAGYRVVARIVVWEADAVLSVPASAIFQRDAGWHVYVVEDGRARLRALEIGRRGEEAAEVLGGLEEGTEIVVFPSAEVEDGVRVRGQS